MVTILDVPFSPYTLQKTCTLLSHQLDRGTTPFHVVTANPEIVMIGTRNPDYLSLLQNADLVVADGIGVVLASRSLDTPLPERVAGYDLLHGLLQYREERKLPTKIYALGSTEEVVALAAEALTTQYEHVEIVGFHHGFFSEEEEAALVASISATTPDLVLAGLGAPKQEFFLERHKKTLGAKVLIGCGGSLDVLSGKTKRAPRLFQKLNLEWLWRLLSQPTRLKRQVDLIRFLQKVNREKKRINR